MATKVLDFDKVLVLLRKYRPGLTVGKLGGGTSVITFLCPFHNDTNPSFLFNYSKGSGNCFACRAKASLIEVVAKCEHTSYDEAERIVEECKRFVKHDPDQIKAKFINIAMAQLQEWNTALKTDTKLLTLCKKWGWSEDILDKYLLGSSDGRLVIPMFEKDSIVALKYYSPGSKTVKYQNIEGSTQCCWPLENLQEDVVYLVEGEKDCLTMLSVGFNAVTFTTGASSVPKEYIRYFAGKTVYIIYDIDEIGRKGAVTTAQILNCATKKVYIVELPLEGIPKGDITDAYMNDPVNFKEYIDYLIANTTEYQAPAAVSRVIVPPEIHKTYLEDIVAKKLFYKRVKMKVRVVNNSQHETTIVPRDVEVTCNRDYKDSLCQQCPSYYAKEGMYLHVRPEYPELMSMVGNNVKVQRVAIQSMTAVIEGCTKFKIEQKSHQALYPIVLIPAIEADKVRHNYQLVTAWALDVPSKENVDYEVEGVVLANPETQKLELICYEMLEDTQSLDSFELTEELITQLGVFRCQDPLLIASPAN